MNSAMLKTACESLKVYYNGASECEKIVIQSAIASTVTGAILGAIPAVGPGITQIAAGGVVISMYVRINKKLGLTLATDILKSIVSVIGIEIGASIGVAVLATIASLVPVIGQIGSSVMTAAAQFVFVYICGYLYIQILTVLAKNKVNLNNLGEDDIKKYCKETIHEVDIDKLKAEGWEIHRQVEKSGEIEKAKTQCPFCQQSYYEKSKFCPNCGEQLVFDVEQGEN